MKRHYPAFTLAEVTIAMLVSSIVISAAMFTLEKLGRASHQWEVFQRENFRQSQGLQVLAHDFDKAQAVHLVDAHLVLLVDSTIVLYTLGPALVRKTGAARDTLLEKTGEWRVFFLPGTTLVDTLALNFHYQHNVLPCTLVKQYPYADITPHLHGNTD